MRFIALALLLAGCAVPSSPRVGDTGTVIVRPLPQAPQAKCNPECAGAIPVTRLDQHYVTVYRTVVPVTAGSTMLVIAQVEVTNDLGYTIGLGRYLQRTLNGSTVLVNRPNMANVTSQMHHESLVLPALDEIEADGEATYELIMYAVSPYVIDGDFIRVEQNYGGLAVRSIK